MSLYQKIKSAITVRQVGEMYGMEPDRHGMVCCPFHSDNHPSMMLNESYYYCFACGANGDAIDLTAKLFDLNPRQAAEKIASDFGLDPDKPPANAIALTPPKRGLTDEQWADIAYCLRGADRLSRPAARLARALQARQPGRTAGRAVRGSPPHDRDHRAPDGLRCIWDAPAEGRCRRTAAVRVVPVDAGGAHRPPCSGKVRLTIHSPKVVLIIMISTTLLFERRTPL